MTVIVPGAASAEPARSLLARLATGTQPVAVAFAGQGADALTELAALVARRPALRDGLEVATAVLADAAGSPEGQASGRFRHGLDLLAWATDPDGAPPARYLRSAAVSYPLILATQALLWRALWEDGLGEVVGGGAIAAVAGHSQGMLAALLVAEAGAGGVDDALLARYVRLAWTVGLHAANASSAGPEPPLAAISGARLERLAPLLEEVNAEVGAGAAAAVALVNAPQRIVVGGPPATLALLRARLAERGRDEQRERRAGRRGGAPLEARWSALEVDVAFHTAALAPARDALRDRLRIEAGLLPAPADLALAVLAPSDGADLRGREDLADAVADGQLVAPVRWDVVCRALVARGAEWVLDLGPGTDVAALTAENLRGRGPRTLALASPEGRRRLTSPGAAPAGPAVRYADFAPGVVELPDGRRHLDGRYTRIAGRPPVILAGMTPTTSDAAIVAAAANAGYAAELAGGGQPDRWTFERRIEELGELLEPGREVVVNTLLLDRDLWALHVARDALVVRARRGGAPLAGVTVSAGIPDVEEAVALLETLRAAGLHLNAFKPGTVAQIRQLLAIADAAPQHTIAVHVEGGRGGGHHSWEELDELLLETYHELRRRENVLVCAGGGVGDPRRAAQLLCGDWSLPYGEPPMPVDAVLVGTAAMACREAAASPAVKRALVAAAGSADWIARGASAGGVTSTTSRLDADIHLLDNAAARAARLLDEVAGDGAAVRARRDEIVAALAQTAKPYLGDVEAMSYGELLAAFGAHCASGRGGRYDDGAWGHPSWRARALALYRRFAARLHPADSGPVEAPVAVLADLDEPAAALAAFRAAFPAADTTLLHPADAEYVLEVCDRPGKPVPFVPVLDGDVRRWYMADALWQAQDERLDADGVFVLPGPRSVAGIERADEPVAELLARFEQAAVARVLEGGGAAAQPVRRERLADPGLVPPPLATAIAGHDGPVAALCAAPSLLAYEGGVRRARPNPLWRVVVPGDEVRALRGDDGRLARVEVLPAGAVGERLEVAADGDEVVVSVAMPALDGPPAELVTRWRPIGAGAFVAADGDAGTIAFAREVLGAPPHAVPRDPLDPVCADWSCPPGLAAAHAAATGAAHDGPGLDLALTLAWPAVAALLSSDAFAARLAQLLHAGHEIEPGPAWPPRPGERGRVEAHIAALDDPDGAPTRLTCRAVLDGERGRLATLDVHLATLGGAPVTERARVARTTHDVALRLGAGEARWLAERDWWPGVELAPGEAVRIEARCTTDEPRARAARWSAEGRVLRDGEIAGEIAWSAPADGTREHPVAAALAALAPAPPARRPRPPAPLADARDAAPASMEAFARIGGDRNPLHRCVLAARLGGMERPIVHGAWTAARASAFVVDALCDGDARRLRRWRVDLVAPLLPGAAIELEAARAGVERGLEAVAVTLRADGETVATGAALIAPAPTVLVFTGQGVQHRGLGADGRDRSAAARAVWQRADAHTRARLGFSLLDVVERNPTELRLPDGEPRRHPDGALHRTEFTQPALLTLAAAQLAELREAGVLPEDGPQGTAVPLGDGLLAAGHSVGEFAALLALGVLELEPALELVHRRGELMQACVARGADGASRHALAVFDPSLGGELPADAGVEVVSDNALGRQLGVAGERVALEALAARLPRGALRLVAGVDVPFHSSALAPAVDGMRAELERLLGPVDAARLVGRWVPNVTGEPFELEPGGDARARLIDLLSLQLAAPVRWVDTQRALLAPAAAGGLGAQRIVELGPAGRPVLTGLMRLTLESLEPAGAAPVLLHVEDDRDALLLHEPAPAAEPPGDDERPAPAPAAGVQPPDRVPERGAAPADRPLDAGAALRLVLAAQARVRPDQLDDDETLDDLFQGASSRRNQVLLDLGRELGLTSAEGAARRTVGELADALREQCAHYRFPGPYLRDTLAAGLTRALGRSGLARADAQARLTTDWALGPGLVDHVLALLALETRPGASARGGPLGQLAEQPATTREEAHALVDRAAALAGDALGLPLARAAAPTTAPARADAGPPAGGRVERALADAARGLLAAVGDDSGPGIDPAAAPTADLAAAPREALERLATLDAELGPERAQQLAPRFDARRHVRFASGWASARWDLVAAYHAALRGEVVDAELERLARHAGEPAIAATACFLAGRAAEHGAQGLAAALARTAQTAPPSLPLAGRTALVTGASPGSIAAELTRCLLGDGATVVVATSTDTPARRRWYRELHRTAAAPGAELHVLPANLASFADVDALAAWLAPLAPAIVAPFAALPTVGALDAAGAGSEVALRLQLLGIERLVAAIAAQAPATAPAPTILLPLSPNHGGFGGDGVYPETKAALEVLLARWRSERSSWGGRVGIVAPRIGWVRGTGLMAAADELAPLVEERLGVRTFSAAEMGAALAALVATDEQRARAAQAPIEVDLSGGLAAVEDLHGAIAPLAAELRERAAAQRRRTELDAALVGAPAPRSPSRDGDAAAPVPLEALPSCDTDAATPAYRAEAAALPAHGIDPAELVVIAGFAELGPCGTSAARLDVELHGAPGPAAVAELAWLCGLVDVERDGYRLRWVDAQTRAEVAEAQLPARYAAAVAARIGVRALEDDGTVDAAGRPALAPVALPAELRFAAADEQQARTFEAAGARVHRAADGAWQVVLAAGSEIRVPRTVPHARRVAGQLPRGLRLGRFGIPDDLLAGADRMALVNLACTAEAFASAGITPEELLAVVHPALVGSTQGCGMGGMASVRRLFGDGLLDGERQADRLQESLGNVVAAHAVQAFLGSYGPMTHPVAACATAAVSLEEAHDKIRAGKALAVLAGGFDDLTADGLLGFGDMGATAASDELDALGLAPHEASRANDVRRRGFVEAQGGGALLVVRGDVALALGLPVRGVLAYASSHGDGIHGSIPAPGMGLLASALGGERSPLAQALARLGLSADDIAVVSKHDTSTPLNDPNEADLHERIQAALGRTPGNPLLVVSQKTVTGHAKGGSAAWQVAGLLQLMERGVVPGNRNLECADPLLRDGAFLTLGDRPIALAAQEPIRAGLVASLGFGHVSALLAIAHPDCFLAAVPPGEREDYLRRAGRRRAEGAQRLLRARLGRPEAIRRTARRLDAAPGDVAAERAAEAALLTDPALRLGPDGVYRSPA